jgi:diguanylate cyclase (GGDEF)-like protein
VILPDADLESTQARAETLRETAKNLIAQYRGKALDRVTLPAGVSAYPSKGSSSELLLRAADAALYRAKLEGRDRVGDA